MDFLLSSCLYLWVAWKDVQKKRKKKKNTNTLNISNLFSCRWALLYINNSQQLSFPEAASTLVYNWMALYYEPNRSALVDSVYLLRGKYTASPRWRLLSPINTPAWDRGRKTYSAADVRASRECMECFVAKSWVSLCLSPCDTGLSENVTHTGLAMLQAHREIVSTQISAKL